MSVGQLGGYADLGQAEVMSSEIVHVSIIILGLTKVG